MERRRLMFMGLASAVTATLGLAAATTAQAAVLGDTTGLSRGALPGADPEPLVANGEDLDAGNVQLVQGWRRDPRRCVTRTRNVRYRDRFGRVRHRQVTERVCR